MTEISHDDFTIMTDKKNKMVQLTGEVSPKSVHLLKNAIVEVVNSFKKADSRVVHLHLQSEGGCLFSGIGMTDWCKLMKNILDFKLHCYCIGIVASAASNIFLAGDERWCGHNSYMLIHALSTNISGDLIISTGFEEAKQDVKNDQIIMNRLIAFYKERTTITDKMISKCMKKDIYLTHAQCVKYGFDNSGTVVGV